MRSRGSRLPTDWILPVDWKEEARAERPDLNLELVAKKFKDHWRGKAGKEGIKLDWQATWRNWVRNETVKPFDKPEPVRPLPTKPLPETPEQAAKRKRDEQAAWERQMADLGVKV